MYADIEALVLSGELFNGPERSSSPTRSVHDSDNDSDAGWHDDELLASKRQEHIDKGLDFDPAAAKRDALRQADSAQQSIGMGPGRTGVKGVIRDRDEAQALERDKRAKEMEGVRRKMQQADLGGKTFLEEEREKAARGEKADELVVKEQERLGRFGQKKEGRFGHLREVGLKGFLTAVEKEEHGVWVVVHLYDASLERCYLIDEKLARLAREYPDTKFLRARAAALGFASTSTTKPKPSLASSKAPRRRHEDDDDDPYDEKDGDYEDDEAEDFRDDDVDLDMLPTMLVYRTGELVHNWVRVDWEAGDAGLDELLDKHHILSHVARKEETEGNGDDSDFDFTWSDEDI